MTDMALIASENSKLLEIEIELLLGAGRILEPTVENNESCLHASIGSGHRDR